MVKPTPAEPKYFTVSFDPVDNSSSTDAEERMVYAEIIRGYRNNRWYDFGVVPVSNFKDSLLAWISGVHSEMGDRMWSAGPTGDLPVCSQHTVQPAFVPESQAKTLLHEAKARYEAVIHEMSAQAPGGPEK